MKPNRNDPCSCGSGKKYKHCCERKAVVGPVMPVAKLSQLQSLFNARQFAETETLAVDLLKAYSDEPTVWKLLAMSLQMQSKPSLSAFQMTAELLPHDAGAQTNLGNALQEAGRLEEAASNFKNALKISKNFVHAHHGLGSVLIELGRLDEAVASYRTALRVNPGFNVSHYNLGCALLALGKYSEGWQEYEYRLQDPELEHIRNASKLPRWRGHNASLNERLLVFGEQGFGDTLQFGRYLTLAMEKFPGGVSLVVNEPLCELFYRSFPKLEVLSTIPTDQRAWQWHCPLLSMPLVFNNTLESIPKIIPYLTPNPVRVSQWRNRIAALSLPENTLKIGMVWKPGAQMKNANKRSLTMQQIAPLLNQTGCIWFSLQKEPDPDIAPWLASGKLIDWSNDLGDFNETAALASNLDLVISVDTSVVHLAGSLGLPTWLFNRHASEWRWMRDREDSPWYPSMRVFNQKRPGDWNEVVEQMLPALKKLIRFH